MSVDSSANREFGTLRKAVYRPALNNKDIGPTIFSTIIIIIEHCALKYK